MEVTGWVCCIVVVAVVVRILVEFVAIIVGRAEVSVAVVDWAGGSTVCWGRGWCSAMSPIRSRGAGIGGAG